ncbi:hypothetical protein P8C59_000622 [Phyllachora maydis]|uniref:Uncharacterized protein n=1 Tax=Phyllachora maydis TaxID=1825666 RepID=A0AAD9M6P5_9PEZI|nr:hypothetical protein P8C59_000622 [Phyllachora maydis]
MFLLKASLQLALLFIIKTSDGRCLLVDKLSGDFRENLTPIRTAVCGSTEACLNFDPRRADPTAGDFRKNLIPVGLVECAGSPNEKWDIITQGTHNDQPSSALVVSSLTQGCISFDGRREANDTVTIFSCGGRADGSGKTQADQLFSYAGELSFALAPRLSFVMANFGSEKPQRCGQVARAGTLSSICHTGTMTKKRRFFTSTLYIEGPAQREPWRGTHEAKSVRVSFPRVYHSK